MKISELIENLLMFKEELGDITVVIEKRDGTRLFISEVHSHMKSNKEGNKWHWIELS